MSAQELITEHLDLWTGAVTKKSSSGRGSNGKVELTGIKKLRELILELAVRGKLVAQYTDDEPIDLLFEKIESEKSAQLKAKTIRKPKKLPDVQKAEQPFSIPGGWRYCRLNELGIWGSGATPKRGNAGYYGGGIPWFKSGELYKDFIDSSEETITDLAVQETSVRINRPGDVLIAMYGATIGKASILEVAGATNQAVCACTPWPDISNRFLLLLLKAYRPRFIAMGAGGAQPNISREKIIATVIGLPPEQEQHRIVQKVDELMALCDRLEQQTCGQIEAHETLVDTLLGTLTQSENATELADSWTRIAAHFDTLFTTEQSIENLKKAIHKLAVMGKLVDQDSGEEPAAVLLKRVKKQLKKDNEKPLIRDKSTRNPADYQYSIPRGWTWCEVNDVFVFINGKAHEKYVAEYGRYTLINSRFVSNSGTVRKHVSERLTPLNKGDIAIVMSDVPNGRALARCYLVEADDEYTLNQRIGGLVTSPELNRSYLVKALNRNPYILGYDDGKKQTNLKKIQILSTPLPLPPLEEQHRIVQKVDELMTLCDQLKERLGQASQARCELAGAVVEGALSH